MPRRGRDGGAARADAAQTLADNPQDAQQRARAADRAFFGANPHAGSYVRGYFPGEVHPEVMIDFPGEPEAVAVAVAQLRPGAYVRVAVFPGASRAAARLAAEQQARTLPRLLGDLL